MKTLPLLGGVFGFGMAFGLGLLQQNPLRVVLLRAVLAMLGGAILLRWWAGVWRKGLQSTLEERHDQ